MIYWVDIMAGARDFRRQDSCGSGRRPVRWEHDAICRGEVVTEDQHTILFTVELKITWTHSSTPAAA